MNKCKVCHRIGKGYRNEPTGYFEWEVFAERLSRTHHQEQCPGCGRYTIWVRDTTAEERFKKIVNSIIDRGVYPGPTIINVEVHGYKSNHLNGRETRWRREVMKERNIELLRPNADLPLTDYDVEWGSYV